MNEIVMPNGQSASEFVKAKAAARPKNITPHGDAQIVGFSPWRDVITRSTPMGGSVKKAKWRDYYDMYRQHSIVRAAIDTLADSAANTDFDFVPRDTRKPPKKREIQTLKDFFGNQADFSGEVRRIYKDLFIYGDAYMYIVPDKRRRPVRLMRLHPRTISIKASINGDILNYYQKNNEDPTSTVITFGPQEIIHFKIDDPDNDLYGLSPLESLKLAVATDLYAQKFNGSFFKNSAVTGTIIVIKSADPNEIQRNREYFKQEYTGPDNAHRPLVLQGEGVDVKKMIASQQEMGFIEGRKQIMTEILAVLKVPPTKIGITESANRSNSAEQDKSFRSESVGPFQKLIEDAINTQFVKNILGIYETKIAHSQGDLRDSQDQMDLWDKGLKIGIYTINEVRSALGMPDQDGGDIPFIMGPTGPIPVPEMPLYSIIPQVQTGKMDLTHPGGAAVQQKLVSGDKNPKNDTTTLTGKAINPAYSLGRATEELRKAKLDENALHQAYAYITDLSETTPDARVTLACDALSKACRNNEDIYLKTAYIDRATSYLREILDVSLAPIQQEEDDDEQTTTGTE